MVTKAQIKFVKNLSEAKGRRETGCFKAEGTKCVIDTLGHFELESLFATPSWLQEHPERAAMATECSRADLERMSSLSTAPQVIAVYHIPEYHFDKAEPAQNLVLALDTIQDPGNLGTIVRIADWFGIRSIICTRETVDLFNPKTVQATMGAISRVVVTYHDNLAILLGEMRDEGVAVCGTFLGGENIYSTRLPRAGVIVIGNEGRGISPEVEAAVSLRLTIPSYPPGEPTSESLNAAVATAVTVSLFRQAELKQ